MVAKEQPGNDENNKRPSGKVRDVLALQAFRRCDGFIHKAYFIMYKYWVERLSSLLNKGKTVVIATLHLLDTYHQATLEQSGAALEQGGR